MHKRDRTTIGGNQKLFMMISKTVVTVSLLVAANAANAFMPSTNSLFTPPASSLNDVPPGLKGGSEFKDENPEYSNAASNSNADKKKKILSVDDFLGRAVALEKFEEVELLRDDSIETENFYRELFARKRDNWKVPELDDNFHYLIDVFSPMKSFDKSQSSSKLRDAQGDEVALEAEVGSSESSSTNGTIATEVLKCLPRFEEDNTPRVFPLKNRRAAGELGTVPSLAEFKQSWDSLTEDCLRFLDWKNVLAAGGAVAGCLAPLPAKILEVKGFGPERMARRKYFHDEFLPGSDIDLFLYGLSEEEAKEKLLEIYDAVQAASPFPVMAFRSAHAITLVSQYPFRHVQIVLRIYNSASEILCGFDVDSCAVGFDGGKVVVPPRTAMAIMTQSNTIDMSRRSPSYEMRLSKYASRGFEVILPSLERDRIDPFLYEKRFDEAKGLSRLLLLEKLRTPEERLRYRIERQIQTNGHYNGRLLNRLRQLERDRWNLDRREGLEEVPLNRASEASDYSTIFLPWGPEWDAKKIKRQTKKNDDKMNKYDINENGEFTASERKYKIHLYAVGTMEEVIKDPFPNDPPLPKDLPSETRESIVHGQVTWLVDNPGRQKIGSFNPISDEDWKDGTYFSVAAETLTMAVVANDVGTIEKLLKEREVENDEIQKNFLGSKDFLGRSILHLAALNGSTEACKVILDHTLVDSSLLQARLPDGRTALHIAAMKGNLSITKFILEKRQKLAEGTVDSVEKIDYNVLFDILDIDCADWEIKFSPLQYAIALGQVEIVRLLLHYNADVRKVAVHKDFKQSLSCLYLLAIYSSECGKTGISNVKPIINLLLAAGASFTQVDTENRTCWHFLAMCKFPDQLQWNPLSIFLEAAKAHTTDSRLVALDNIDQYLRSPLNIATLLGNHKSVESLLASGASPFFSKEQWIRMLRAAAPGYRGEINEASDRMEMLRSPIFVAAESADVSTLEVYCKANNSYANLSITVLERSDRSPKTIRVLDYLDLLQREEDSSEDRFYDDRKLRLKDLEEVGLEIEAKYETLLKNDPTSLEVMWLSLMLEHNKVESEKMKKWIKRDPREDSAETKKNRLTKIRDAISFIENNGGEREPCEASIRRPPKTDRFRYPLGNRDVNVPDPMKSFAEMRYFGFFPYLDQILRRESTVISSDTMSRIVKLFYFTDTGKIDELRHAVDNTNVFIKNSVGQTTPLFLAVKNKNIEATRIIFEGASKQYLSHIEMQMAAEKRKKKQEEEMNTRLKKVDSKENSVQSLANRINNMNPATGDLPNLVPGPSAMRLKLEDAEKQLLLDEDESRINELSSDIPPGLLLLQRSRVLTEGRLLDLKSRLKKLKVRVRHDDRTISLTPLELAVVNGDLTMVNELIYLARNMILHTTIGEVEVDDEMTSNDDESSESVGANSEESLFNERAAPNETSGAITEAQLRYLMVGPGSFNPDLGVSLVELAIISDNVDIFISIILYAKEFALPLRLIDLWKDQNGEHKKDDQPVQRNYSPVHFMIKCGSQNLINALISKKMDCLIQWLFEEQYKSPTTSTVDRDFLEPFYAASKWISDQIVNKKVSEEKVVEKLWHVVTVDQRARTLLFYAPADLVSPIVAAGAEYIASTSPSLDLDAARLDFVNRTTPNGVTALMSAAALGDKDKVKILLQEGANRSLHSCDRKKWGVIHFVLTNKIPAARQEIIELLLKDASDSELNTMLLSPQTEHTPLMIAVSNDTDEGLALLLIEKTASCAIDSLSRRDKDMDSVLHLAVHGIIHVCNRKVGFDTINALLSLLPPPTGVENARGLTASDIYLKHILSSLWKRGPGRYLASGNMKTATPKHFTIIKDSEPRVPFGRELLELLINAEANNRVTIGFNEAKLNTKRETEFIQENSNSFQSEFSATSEEDCQIPGVW